jgi:hypothetical protein
VSASSASSDEEARVRTEFLRRADAGESLKDIKASEIGETVGATVVAQTVRRWVKSAREEYESAHAAEPERAHDVRAEVRLADPPETGDVVDPGDEKPRRDVA